MLHDFGLALREFVQLVHEQKIDPHLQLSGFLWRYDPFWVRTDMVFVGADHWTIRQASLYSCLAVCPQPLPVSPPNQTSTMAQKCGTGIIFKNQDPTALPKRAAYLLMLIVSPICIFALSFCLACDSACAQMKTYP